MGIILKKKNQIKINKNKIKRKKEVREIKRKKTN